MNHSKEQEYLKDLKRNHLVHVTNYEHNDDDKNRQIWNHLRQLKNVQRLSGIKLIQSYTVADHCYYTGILFEQFIKDESIEVGRPQIAWVYRHDILESITGDLLYPAKNYNVHTSKLWEEIELELTNDLEYNHLRIYTDYKAKENFSSEAWELFKIVDWLELYLFCMEETRLGNHQAIIQKIIHNSANTLTSCKFKSIGKWM